MRIVLRGLGAGEEGDLIVDHPRQPQDYFHADRTIWTGHERWRIAGGVPLRAYDLVTSIVLRVLAAVGDPSNPVVDHPGQPADYVHTDGAIWTWRERWRPLGDGHYLRVYDLVTPSTESN
jgi:hypothetical protein